LAAVHRLHNRFVKWDPPDNGDLKAVAILLNFFCVCQIHVILVDADRAPYAKMLRGVDHSFHIVHTRYRRLGDDKRHIHAGDRGDDRAADARRSVYNRQLRVASFLRELLLYRRYQLARRAAAHPELRGGKHALIVPVKHQFARYVISHGNRLRRADFHTNPAAFALEFANRKVPDCLKTAVLFALPAADAFGRVDHCFSEPVVIRLFRLGHPRYNQMKVGSVHIAIRESAAAAERDQGARHRGLARAALAA